MFAFLRQITIKTYSVAHIRMLSNINHTQCRKILYNFVSFSYTSYTSCERDFHQFFKQFRGFDLFKKSYIKFAVGQHLQTTQPSSAVRDSQQTVEMPQNRQLSGHALEMDLFKHVWRFDPVCETDVINNDIDLYCRRILMHICIYNAYHVCFAHRDKRSHMFHTTCDTKKTKKTCYAAEKIIRWTSCFMQKII